MSSRERRLERVEQANCRHDPLPVTRDPVAWPTHGARSTAYPLVRATTMGMAVRLTADGHE